MPSSTPPDLPSRSLPRSLAPIVASLEFDPPGEPLTIDVLAAHTDGDRQTVPDIARRLEKLGWLHRVKRGLYEFVPAGALYPSGSPWPLLSSTSRPYLVSGLTAAGEHGLTPQLATRHLVVFDVTRNVPTAIVASPRFRVARLRPWRLFGASTVVLDGVPIRVADLERILLDAIEHPDWFSGVGETARILRRGLPKADRARLLEGADAWRSSSLCRRLGWWGERTLSGGWTDAESEGLHRGLRSDSFAPLVPGTNRAGIRDPGWGIIVNVPESALDLERSIR